MLVVDAAPAGHFDVRVASRWHAAGHLGRFRDCHEPWLEALTMPMVIMPSWQARLPPGAAAVARGLRRAYERARRGRFVPGRISAGRGGAFERQDRHHPLGFLPTSWHSVFASEVTATCLRWTRCSADVGRRSGRARLACTCAPAVRSGTGHRVARQLVIGRTARAAAQLSSGRCRYRAATAALPTCWLGGERLEHAQHRPAGCGRAAMSRRISPGTFQSTGS